MNEYPPQPGLEPAPQYPPPPPPPQEKPSFWKRKIAGVPIWAFVPVAIIALLIVGRALATNAPSNSATIQSTPTATPDLAATNVANAQATQNAATPYSGTPTNTGY